AEIISSLQIGHAGSGDVSDRPANFGLLRGRPTDSLLVGWAVREPPWVTCVGEAGYLLGGLSGGGFFRFSGGSDGWWSGWPGLLSWSRSAAEREPTVGRVPACLCSCAGQGIQRAGGLVRNRRLGSDCSAAACRPFANSSSITLLRRTLAFSA